MFKSFLLSICVVSAQAWSLNYHDSPVRQNVYSDGSTFGGSGYLGSGYNKPQPFNGNLEKKTNIADKTFGLDGA